MPLPLRIVRGIGRLRLPRGLQDRLNNLQFGDAGHGYDVFGANPHWVGMGLAGTRFLYEQYFRVRSTGAENLPTSGPGILAANHSGTLPFDGAMLYNDVVRNTDPPRLARPIADRFVPHLPFISTFFARVGVVTGSRGNVRALLESGELLMIFPEGTPGIGKRYEDRYQLQYWREGHVELAIRYRAPVIPVGIIGPEEQMPQIARIPIKAFGAPYLPVPATPFPLPVRYHIHYGEPIPLHEEYPPEASNNPALLTEAALKVKQAVQDLLDRGLEEREGVFT